MRTLLVGLVLVTVAAGGAIGFWWQGRPARHLAEARRLIEEGEPGEALAWLPLPEASASTTTRDQAHLLRARVAVAQHRPEDAVEPLRRIDPEGPSAPEAAYWKARALHAAGNSHLAIAWYRRALDRQPDHLDAHRWLAAAAYDQGDWKTAVAALERVVAAVPEDPRAWRTLGLLAREENQLDSARVAYGNSLRSDPAQPKVRRELAEILVEQGRFDEADAQLALCRGGISEPDRLALKARCHRDPRDRAALVALLDEGLRLEPGHPGLLAERAALDLVEGRAAEAVAGLDRALAAAPSRRALVYQRATALRAAGRDNDARDALRHYQDLDRLATELGTLTRRAVERPDDPTLRCRLGALAQALHETRQAAYWYRAALACDPSNAEARAALRTLEPR